MSCADAQAKSSRITVISKRPRRRVVSVLANVWSVVRGYLAPEPAVRRRALVLAFRRPDGHGHLVPQGFAVGDVLGKRANGRARWQGDHAAAPQEEGRG